MLTKSCCHSLKPRVLFDEQAWRILLRYGWFNTRALFDLYFCAAAGLDLTKD